MREQAKKLFGEKAVTLSFEYFPPKDEKARFVLEETVGALTPLGPDFVSVTDRDAGAYRDMTREICQYVMKVASTPTVAHLTCLGNTRGEMKEVFDALSGAGINGVMALRGDPPPGENAFVPTEGGCRYSGELIELLAADGRFAIGCASYPDGHPEAVSKEEDWKVLINKFKGGADFSVTQIFFDNNSYAEMVDYISKEVDSPRVVPGIMPITNWTSVKRFCKRCEAELPQELFDLLDPLEGDSVACRRAGIEYTIRQCKELIEKYGAPGLHIYSLNRSTAAAEIVTALRLLGSL